MWLESTGSAGGKVTMTCGQVMTAPPVRQPDYDTNTIQIKPQQPEESYDTDYGNHILIDDTGAYPSSPGMGNKRGESLDNMFDTYDFIENQGSFQYNIDEGMVSF